MMTSMAECFTLQHSTLNIPFYDSKNIPLKNFLQNIRNGAVFVPPALESSFLKAVLGKLQKTARDSTWGKTFNNLDELIKYLKARFGSDKTYSDYHHEIENIRMNRGETVNDFHDRLNILFNGAKTVLEDKYPENAGQMLEPIKEVALEAFIRGLPDKITRAVDARDPKNLEEALKFARWAEIKIRSGILPSGETTRVTFAENSRPVSPSYSNSNNHSTSRHYQNYSITRREGNHSRSPSPNPVDAQDVKLKSPKPTQSEYTNYPRYSDRQRYNHQGHPTYPFYPPYFYPRMAPFPPYYPPYPAYHHDLNNRPPNASSRPNSPYSSRPPSPHPSKINSTTDSNNLNSQTTRREDAAMSPASTERHTTARNLKRAQ